jgi:hypothetical protein
MTLYVGFWAIREDRLFLIDIETKISDGSATNFLDLFLGGEEKKVHAG